MVEIPFALISLWMNVMEIRLSVELRDSTNFIGK